MSAAGRQEHSQNPYDMEALAAFRPVTSRIFEHCAIAGVGVDTLSHETGAAQLEVNLLHGDPLRLADQVVLFKRIARDAALAEGMHATFMAKPTDAHPGSAMHLHVSLTDAAGDNLFADGEGADTPMFGHFMGGLQKYIPAALPLFAPHVNSYRRIRPNHSAPANVEWSYDNRSCGLRVPKAGRDARRVENRLPGADANPYLAIAATLACGYLGMIGKMKPKPPVTGSAYRLAYTLPQYLPDALMKMSQSKPMRGILGSRFVDALLDVRRGEWDAYQRVISPWERAHLLLNV
jgi:glutamine synthetase